MADTICASQGPRNPRLGEVLLAEQCVTARLSTGTTEKSSPPRGGRARKRAHLVLDAAQAHLHLDLIGLDERCTNLRFIPHKGRRGGAINANFSRDLERAQEHNNKGFGIYLQPNVGNGTKADDVTACTCLFIEFDHMSIEEQLVIWRECGLPEPTFMVLTQGRSVHLYWVFTVPIEPERWVVLLDRLHLAAPGCDQSCKGKNRMMRMAGAHYINADGESNGVSEVINVTGYRYDAAFFEETLPLLPSRQPCNRAPRKFPRTPGNLRKIAEALDCIPQRVEGSGTYSEYRNILWGLIAACGEEGYREEVAIDLMEAHSPSRECGWHIPQVARSGGEQIGPGTLFHYAKQHGWRSHE